MVAFTLRVTPLIQHILEITSSNKFYSKQMAYTNNFTVVSSIKYNKCPWEHLNLFAGFFGYYLKASKSYLIVKSQYLETVNVVFRNTKVNLTSEGMQHFGTVIGNYFYKEKYVNELVTILKNQLQILL